MTEMGDADVPVGITVTPTGVVFPPHRANPAARTITAPIFQTRILTPPSHLERFSLRAQNGFPRRGEAIAKSQMFMLKSLSYRKPESLFRLDQSRWDVLELPIENVL